MIKTLKPVCLMVVLALVLSLAGVVLPAGVAQAADTGLQSPTATAPIGFGWDQNTSGFTTYAYADDSNYARGENGEGQIYFNYGFSIPSGATIDGIEVSLDSWYSFSATNGKFRVFLTWNWGSNMTAYKEATLTASETRHVLGGPTDTWGHTWTASELSNANFQVRIYAYTDAMCLLDWIPVTVYYTPPPGTLFEHYNTGDDNVWGFYSQYWKAQTFAATSNHSVTSVKLKLYRSGNPGTITAAIRATDIDGHPTGADLTSGTTDGNALTTDTGGEWKEIDLTSYPLISGTKYAIVVKALGGDASNRVWWRLDESSPTYDGGNLEHSENSGTTWTAHTDKDFMFEVYGETLFSVAGTTGEVNCDTLSDVTVTLYQDDSQVGDPVYSDVDGNYTLPVPAVGDYEVRASKTGYRNETQQITITDPAHTLDFRGEHGLVPNAPSMSYVLDCVHYWLYPDPPYELSMSKVLDVVHAWLYPISP